MNSLVYLASPIDFAAKEQSYIDRWRIAVEVELSGRGWTVYRPHNAFRTYGVEASDIYAANMRVLKGAAALVAILPAGVQTHGVPAEIQYAIGEGIPVLIFTEKYGATAAGWDSHVGVKIRNYAGGYVRPNSRTETEMNSDARCWTWLGNAVTAKQERRAENFVRWVVGDGGKLPTRAYGDDAGWDLYTRGTHTLDPGTFFDVPTGVSCQLPERTWGLLIGRSSTLRKRGLMVSQGVIDYGYRGELYAGVWNLTDEPIKVEDGERLAQLIVHHTRGEGGVVVERLDDHPRGMNGFGSSGK